MKKILAILLSIIIIILSGCSMTVTKTNNEVKEATSATETKTVTETKSDAQKSSLTLPKNQTTNSAENITTKVTKNENKLAKKSEKSTTKATTKINKNSTTKKSTNQIKCSIEISCKSILNNKENLKPGKINFVPTNGEIIKKTTISVNKGSSVFDVLKQACKTSHCSDNCKYCKKNGVQLEYSYTPGYNSYYIEGIHQIYEKDCGTMSGWMYCVNNNYFNSGSNAYKVKDGDNIKWLYTCNLGEDIGA